MSYILCLYASWALLPITFGLSQLNINSNYLKTTRSHIIVDFQIDNVIRLFGNSNLQESGRFFAECYHAVKSLCECSLNSILTNLTRGCAKGAFPHINLFEVLPIGVCNGCALDRMRRQVLVAGKFNFKFGDKRGI
jgi:hypothetical protein